ncbi:MAG: glycerol-3-phosphate dehydrogenase [Spirochaetes bacterium]|nr:MAG: glycerol-3-phosphate dehydrogenase [Spirochaetota bacterium]
MRKKVGILSAGAWGTALGKVLAEKKCGIQIWDYLPEVVEDINLRHTNSRFLLGVSLPRNFTASKNILEVVKGKDYLLLATPSLYLVDVVKKIVKAPNIREGKTPIGILAKGFISTEEGPELITTALEEHLPPHYRNNLVYISGPSHAEEVARGKLTGLISASLNGRNSILFRELLSSPSLMVFSSFDVAGVQTAAAVKNVIAIAFGMLDALMGIYELFGDNTESLLLAAGLNEIQLIGKALGSTHPETFTSIAGVGDLDVTCRSRYGRNRRFGREIITDNILFDYKSLDDLIENIAELGYLPEGIVACKHVNTIAEKNRLKLPVSGTVYSVLNRESEPLDAVKNMLKSITGDFPEDGV